MVIEKAWEGLKQRRTSLNRIIRMSIDKLIQKILSAISLARQHPGNEYLRYANGLINCNY